MHETAYTWLARMAKQLPAPRRVLEFGSRNVNGTPRALFHEPDLYLGIDRIAGPGVAIVADAATWELPNGWPPFDLAICAETLEHAENAESVCCNAYRLLAPGGVLLLTAAADPRPAHTVNGDPWTPGSSEFYRNVGEGELRGWLSPFASVLIDTTSVGDIYARATK